jgi:DNA repair exonuclease SbcCD ATPase subunit
MKVVSMAADNFMSFEHVDFSFPDRGLFFVGGEVVDGSANSNGAGKSSLFDAVTWALYGSTLKTLASKDDVVRRGAGKNGCRVSVNFGSDAGVLYEVVRYRNDKKYGNALSLAADGTDITGASAVVTQEMIDKAAGINFLVFSTAVMFGEKAQRFAEARDSEKKAVMDEILMLHRIQDALKAVKDDQSVLETQWEFLLSSSVRLSDGIKNELMEISKVEEEIVLLEERTVSVVVQIKKLDVDRTVLIQEKVKISEGAVDRSEVDDLQGGMKQLVEQMRQLDIKRKSIKDAFDAKKVVLMTDQRAAVAEIGRINGLIASIKTARAGTRCLACGQLISDEAKHTSAEHYLSELPKYQVKREESSSALAFVMTESDNAVKAIDEEYGSLLKTRIEFESCLAAVNQKAAELVTKLAIIDRKIAALDGQISAMSDMTAAEEQKTRLLKWHEDTTASVTEHKTQLSKVNADIKTNVAEMENIRFWIDGFGNKGIKSLMLDQVIPAITEYANRYAAILMDDEVRIIFETESSLKSGDMRDKFGVKIFVGDTVSDYGSFSSGEKRRIDVAILLSLQKLIFSHANALCNFAVFDEVFDSLDVTGIERTIGILDEEAEDKAIFVISHSQEFAGYFDNIISVKKEKGVSRVIV